MKSFVGHLLLIILAFFLGLLLKNDPSFLTAWHLAMMGIF